MLAEKKMNTNIGVGVGILLQFAGQMLQGLNEEMVIIGVGVSLVGLGVFIWGCINYAQGKGQPGVLGALGMLSCFGLIILVFLEDKHKNG